MSQDKRINYEGQIFGSRIVVRNYCVPEDWENIGRIIPKIRLDKYRLTKCLNCGSLIPMLMKNLKNNPPKHCSFCSRYGQQVMTNAAINNWVIENGIGIGIIPYKNELITCYIDPEDVEKVKDRVWRISKKKNKYYVISGSKAKNNSVYLHTFVLNQDVPEGYEIDHIDGNSLNNKKDNLRIITRQENIVNTRVRIDNKIGIRGISYSKSEKRYIVDFSYYNQRFYFQHWDNIVYAVYCRKFAEEYFGIQILNNNLLAQKYLILSNEDAQKIKTYVEETIENYESNGR